MYPVNVSIAFVYLPVTALAQFAFPPGEYWQVSPPLNYSDELYAGWNQLPAASEVKVYDGLSLGRTYAHHPQIYAKGSTVYLIHSSAVIDEDSMGMEVWGTLSNDSGRTWSSSQMVLPAALLPNQTSVENFSYWCNRAIWQRAIGALAIVELDDEIWAIGQTTNFFCWDDIGSGTRGGGRIAERLSTSGAPKGDPCWLVQNDFTNDVLLYNETIYGTEYGMKYCETASALNEILQKPQTAPAWSDWLYDNKLYAADNKHDMQENTHAIWIEQDRSSPGYWQRFWRDVSATSNSMKVWVEYTFDTLGGDWYPAILQQHGNNITETNIPDAKTKQFLGILDAGGRYLISNPRNNSQLVRQPLTLAMSYGLDLAYKNIGVVRTNASDDIAPDTRDYKNKGFSYPAAVQLGDKLLVVYSENKQNIWVSVFRIEDLPGAGAS